MPLSRETLLWTATVLDAPLPDKLDAAAAAGFDAVSLRFEDVARARADGWSDARIRSEIAARGLRVFAAESLIGWLPGRQGRTAALASTPMHLDTAAALQTAAALGAASLSALDLADGAIDVERAARAFGGICDQAADLGLVVNLEFIPWSAIPDLSTAWSIVTLAGRPNAGLLLDSWHFTRSNSSLEELSRIPGRLVKAVQLNDAPRKPLGDLRSESHDARLLPGQGDIDLVAIVRTLDRIGAVAPIGVEVASTALRARDPASVATEAMTALRAVLELALPTTPLVSEGNKDCDRPRSRSSWRDRTSASEQKPVPDFLRHSRPRSRPDSSMTASLRRCSRLMRAWTAARGAPGATIRPVSVPSEHGSASGRLSSRSVRWMTVISRPSSTTSAAWT